MIKEENRVPKREVMCMKCRHQFLSRIAKPICSKCHSDRLYDIEDVPKTYGGQELKNLRKEHNELKKDLMKLLEFNKKVFNKLLARIKALEAAK